MRADPAMTNAQAFIEGVLYQMMQAGELDTQIVDFNGRPLVKNVTWKGHPPRPRPSNQAKVTLACLAGAAFTFGGILGMIGVQEQNELSVTSLPAHEIAIRELIQKGPGANRHVTLRDYRPGGYAYTSQSGSPPWSEVYVALFPAPRGPMNRERSRS